MRLHRDAYSDGLCAGFILLGLRMQGMLGRTRFRWICKDMVLALCTGS